MFLGEGDFYFFFWAIKSFEKSVGANIFELELFLMELEASYGISDGDGKGAFSCDLEFDIIVVISEGNAWFSCLHNQRIILDLSTIIRLKKVDNLYIFLI